MWPEKNHYFSLSHLPLYLLVPQLLFSPPLYPNFILSVFPCQSSLVSLFSLLWTLARKLYRPLESSTSSLLSSLVHLQPSRPRQPTRPLSPTSLTSLTPATSTLHLSVASSSLLVPSLPFLPLSSSVLHPHWKAYKLPLPWHRENRTLHS